jgi:CBS domain-containing protein/sporulation protein YlmC with PRC-barrel domain
MAFLSEILGRTITDLDGNFVGKLDDLIARERLEFTHPVVEALVVDRRGEKQVVPYSTVMSLFALAIPLKCHIEDIPSYGLNDDDIYLSRDVLDKQIIDTDGARVVRVNDLELVRVNGTLYVSNVDVGVMGILRRVGLEHATHAIASGLHLHLPDNFISWDNVELLHHDQFMRLRVPAESLADLHPADLAEILSDLNKLESGQFLESMNVEQVADALEQVETEFQASLLGDMDDERAADVLEEMEPDEAADLLAELPVERSRRLVSMMDKEEADDVRHLLTFPEDSAGGIMTTDYAVVPPDVTAEQAIKLLRETASDIDTVIYVYVTDVENHLIGVFSLTDLIFAEPNALVSEFMDDRVKTVLTLDDQDEVAQIITKYDLLAVPVVDQQNIIHGIVTADDALDKIIPTAWKKRLPRFYR